MQQDRFLTIDGHAAIGKLYINFHDPGSWLRKDKRTACMLPALQEIRINKYEDFRYATGYIDIDSGIFYPCPLSIFYIQIETFSKKTGHKHGAFASEISFSIKLFSKSYDQSVSLQFTCGRNAADFPTSGWSGDIWDVNTIINNLNLYVENGYALEDLDSERLKIGHNHQPLEVYRLGQFIKEIKIEYYEDSRYRAQRDDAYWSEAEISNFGSDAYIRYLLWQAINNQYDQIVENSDELMIAIFDRHQAAGGTHPRRHVKSIDMVDPIRDRILLDMVPLFDQQEHISWKLSKSPKKDFL